MKRAGRQDAGRVSQIGTYAGGDASLALVYAFMDVALYGTGDKEAALFANADLEDLRLAISIVAPDPDLQFQLEVPDKLGLARE